MKYFSVFLLCLLLEISCKIPYNKKDVFEPKADLSIDEAPHEKNSLEWWYFTGHLKDTVKNRFINGVTKYDVNEVHRMVAHKDCEYTVICEKHSENEGK